MQGSSLFIGQTVKYSVTRDESGSGTVLAEVMMREKVKIDNFDQWMCVTGYLIQDPISGSITSIAYWRIQAVLNAQGKPTTFRSEEMPKGHIQGGYNRSAA